MNIYDVKIDDVFVHKYDLFCSIIITSIEQNTFRYRNIAKNLYYNWDKSTFLNNYIFDQKLTDEYMIKNIIE